MKRVLKIFGIVSFFIFLILLFFAGFLSWYTIIVYVVFTEGFFEQAFYIIGLKIFGWAVLSLLVTVFCFSPFLALFFYNPDE